VVATGVQSLKDRENRIDGPEGTNGGSRRRVLTSASFESCPRNASGDTSGRGTRTPCRQEIRYARSSRKSAAHCPELSSELIPALKHNKDSAAFRSFWKPSVRIFRPARFRPFHYTLFLERSIELLDQLRQLPRVVLRCDFSRHYSPRADRLGWMTLCHRSLVPYWLLISPEKCVTAKA